MKFDDLFNFVHGPATLKVAFDRVAGNRGANTPGVDGLTVSGVEEAIGASDHELGSQFGCSMIFVKIYIVS